MPHTIPPFLEIALGEGGARWPGWLPSDDAVSLERIHKQLRAEVSKSPDRSEQLVCEAVQRCYDMLKRIWHRRGALNRNALEKVLPEKTLQIALDCGWLPPGAHSALPFWRDWISKTLAGRFSRVGLADSCEPDPYVSVPFPVITSAQAEPKATPKLAGQRPTKPGPRRDVDTARKVAEIVARVANGSPWKDCLENICEALDDELVPPPKPWRKRGIRSWCDALDSADDRGLAKKAISHHLNQSSS
jgi:hypothetical protein